MRTIMDSKYDIEVQLVGNDGNAFAIIGKVGRALREANVEDKEIKLFYQEAMSGDYDNVIRTAMKWVVVL